MDNTLGGVYIEIRGDLSKLQGDFSAAEALAARAGTGMSQGLNQASVGADKVVFAIGRLAGVVEQQSAQMSLAFQRNIATLANFQKAATGGIASVGEASSHSVTQIQAVGGAIRTGFGEQSIRAVERFLTLIPGVGAALQFAFPIIGGLAFVEMLSRVFEKSEKVTEAEKALAEATMKADEAFLQTAHTIDSLNAKDIARQFGPAAGARAEITALELQKDDLYKDLQKAKDKLGELATEAQGKVLKRPTGGAVIEEEYKPKFESAGKEIEAAQAKVIAKEAEIKAARTKSYDVAASESGALAAIEIRNSQEKAEFAAEATRKSAIARVNAAHEVRQAELDSEQDTGTRGIKEAEERITRARQTAAAEIAYEQAVTRAKVDGIQARAAAESLGKPLSEQKTIQARSSGEVAAAQREGAQKRLDAMRAADAEEMKLGDAYAKAERGWAESVTRAWEESADRIHKARVEGKDLNSRAFVNTELPGVFNREAEVKASGITAKGAGDAKALEIKRQEIELEGRYAETIFKTARDRIAYLQQIAALEHEEREAKLAGLNADLAIAQSEAEGARGTEAYAAALENVARLKSQIAIAAQEDANASAEAANKAKELAVQKSLAGQISAQLPQGSLLDKTTAVTASTIAGAVDGISSALAKAAIQGKGLGNALKQAGQSLAMTAATGLLKAGLSSALHALMQLIPAFGAVAAAQTGAAATAKATTSATDVGEAEGNAAVAATGAAAAVAWIPLIGPELAVAAAASMLASMQPYVGLAAFAEGTDSAPGGMAMVGERGPELMYVPRGAQIIPNHRLGHFADGVGSTSSFSSSVQANHFHGPMHFHGVQSVDGMMREIALRAKTATPGNSKYAR